MNELGVSRSAYGDYWIVSLNCNHWFHDKHICEWCEQQFGYVDLGACVSHQTQDFYFTHEDHAILCWLTWGSR